MKRNIIIIMIIGIFAVSVFAQEQKTKIMTNDVVCPKCGFKFKASFVLHPDALGGQDTDMMLRSLNSNPVSQNVWMCPKCNMGAFPPDFKQKLPEQIKNVPFILSGLKKDAAQISQEDIPAWLKYENAILFYKAKGIETLSIAGLYIKASWAARLDSVKYSPEMEAITKVIWKEGINISYRSLQTNYENMAIIAADKIKVTKIAPAELPLWNVVYADFLRKSGDHLKAFTVLNKVKSAPAAYKKNQSVIDASIMLCQKEKFYQQNGFDLLTKELDSNKVIQQKVAELRYAAGELARRTGNKAAAKKWFEKSLAAYPKENTFRPVVEQQLKLVQ